MTVEHDEAKNVESVLCIGRDQARNEGSAAQEITRVFASLEFCMHDVLQGKVTNVRP